MNLALCLPPDLRGPATTITRIVAGLSGAGVHRVETAGRTFVLKISDDSESIVRWREKLRVQQAAAGAGLAPAIIHVNESRRAVLSAFVADRSFPAYYFDPRTRAAAVTLLGRTVRRVHDLPLPSGDDAPRARPLLDSIWSGLAPQWAMPAFVHDVVGAMLAESAPAGEGARVTSHNDLNPTNLVYDGEHLLLLDWDSAGPNDPFYDLATAAVFFRLDDETCQQLIAAHDDAAVTALPAEFIYDRRLVAVLSGTMFLHLARQNGHGGATGLETLDSTPSLADCHQQMRAGAMNVATADGQWRFGLAIVKEATRYQSRASSGTLP